MKKQYLPIFFGLLILSMLTVACASQPTPETITVIETVVVEKEVEGETITVVETVVVEKEVEVEVEKVVTEIVEKVVTATPSAAGPQGTLQIAIGADVTSLTNTETTDSGSHAVRHVLYNKLVEFNEQGQIVPELATDWSVSDDRLTWTFNLREDVKFHDGTPFDAEAIVANYERLLSPDQPDTPSKTNTEGIIDSVEAIDEYTVAFRTKEPFGAMLVFLAGNNGGLVAESPTAAAELGEDFQLNPVGTGPYKFVSWDRENEIIFEANPDYWGDPPRVERIVYKIIPDASARTIAVETGEVDVAWLVGVEDLERLEDNPDIDVIKTSSSRTPIFWINLKNEPFNDVRVRRALNHAIDRESIVEFVMQGVATPSECTPIGPGVPGHAPGVCYEYNPEKAKELLAEAGVPEGFEFDLWGPSGRYTKDKELVEAVAGQFEAIGLKPKVQVFGDFPTYLQEALYDPDFDLAFCSIIGVPYDASGYFIFFDADLSGKPFNVGFIENPRVDELLDAGAQETDQEKRQEIYGEIQNIITDEAYYVVLQHEITLTAARKNVDGLIIRPSYELLVDYTGFVE